MPENDPAAEHDAEYVLLLLSQQLGCPQLSTRAGASSSLRCLPVSERALCGKFARQCHLSIHAGSNTACMRPLRRSTSISRRVLVLVDHEFTSDFLAQLCLAEKAMGMVAMQRCCAVPHARQFKT